MLIGAGWNFMYTGGTTLLTQSYAPAEKSRTQGANDFIMFSVMGVVLVLVGRAGVRRGMGSDELGRAADPRAGRCGGALVRAAREAAGGAGRLKVRGDMPRASAGILPYRRDRGRLEVLLVHPGGPFWAHRDDGAWSIAKGEHDESEPALAAAIREFAEETGRVPPGPFAALEPIRQASGKIVAAWITEDAWDAADFVSNRFDTGVAARVGAHAKLPGGRSRRVVRSCDGRARRSCADRPASCASWKLRSAVPSLTMCRTTVSGIEPAMIPTSTGRCAS